MSYVISNILYIKYILSYFPHSIINMDPPTTTDDIDLMNEWDGQEEEEDYDETDEEDLQEPEPEQLVQELTTYDGTEHHQGIIYDLLNRNELTALLCYRTSQLVHGAPPTIPVPSNVFDMGTLARMEYKAGKLPLLVRRVYPKANPDTKPKVEFVRGIPI